LLRAPQTSRLAREICAAGDASWIPSATLRFKNLRKDFNSLTSPQLEDHVQLATQLTHEKCSCSRGELTDDDEVAVTFDPATFVLASYPFVQIREFVRRLPFQQRSLTAIRSD
jgi:hypothetical protein